jgi:hypothetical protein
MAFKVAALAAALALSAAAVAPVALALAAALALRTVRAWAATVLAREAPAELCQFKYTSRIALDVNLQKLDTSFFLFR